MTEDELIERLRVRCRDPRWATGDGKWPNYDWMHAEIFPPAPPKVVQDALHGFGFPLPPLLVRFWSEVANGGVGPGYGIYGLEGGLTHDGMDLPLPDFYWVYQDQPEWIELVGKKSAPRAFSICDWGCCKCSVLDCSAPEGNMLLITDRMECINQGVSFARWIEDWLDGIQVGAEDYGSTGK